ALAGPGMAGAAAVRAGPGGTGRKRRSHARRTEAIDEGPQCVCAQGGQRRAGAAGKGDGEAMRESAVAALEQAWRAAPADLFLVLGSGMGPLVGRLTRITSVPFAEVPGLFPSAVPGHCGALTLGDWTARRVLVSEGRLHYYEGHDPAVVVRPIQL